MVSIKRQLQFVVAIPLLILVSVQLCNANGNSSQSGPVIFSSSSYSLLSEDGKTASGKIFVKNNSDYRVEKFSIKGDVSPIVVDPASSCFKPVESGGMCEFNISYTETLDSPPRTPIRFEVVGDDENFSDSITVNVISVKPEVFFNPADDGTNVKSISGSIKSFVTVNKNGVNFLYAGTYGSGVFKTSDGGANWVAVSNGLTSKDVRALHSSDDYLYAGTYGGGVFKTNDGGANWVAVSNGLTDQNVLVFHSRGDYLYAGTHGGGVFKTNDSGANWVAVSNGLTNKDVLALYSSDSYLYAGTHGGGVFKTNDGGANWVAVSNGLIKKDVRALYLSGNYLYAGTYGGGVFKTNDGGANWVAVSNGLTNKDVLALHSSGDYLYAGTHGGGVFKINDDGANWVEVNNGLTNKRVQALHSSDGYLYAETWGGGVFKMKLSKSLKPEPQKNTEDSAIPKLSTEERERIDKAVNDMQNDCERACKEELMRIRADVRKEDREKCSAMIKEMQKNIGGLSLFHGDMSPINPVPPPVVDYLLIPPGAYETVEGMQNACENACKQELIQKRYAIRKEDWGKCNAIIKKMQEEKEP